MRPKLRKAVGSCWVRLDALRDFLYWRSAPMPQPSGLRFALLSGPGATLLGALFVDVLKSGIYDLWAAVEAP